MEVRKWFPDGESPQQNTKDMLDLISAAKDPLTEAHANFSVALAYVYEQDGSAALAKVDEAHRLFALEQDYAGISRCLALRGVVLSKLARYEEAMRTLDEAWLAFLELGEWLDEPLFDLAWAQCLAGMGEETEALKRFVAALDGAIEQRDASLASEASMSIGETLARLGRHAEALQFVDGARNGFVALRRTPSTAKADRFSAHLLVALGRRDDSVIFFETAFEGFTNAGCHREAAETLREMGRILGDIAARTMDVDACHAALDNLKLGLEAFDILGMEASVAGCHRDIAETLVDLAAISLESAAIAEAIPHYEAAVKGFAALRQPLSATAAARRMAYALELLDRPSDVYEFLSEILDSQGAWTESDPDTAAA